MILLLLLLQLCANQHEGRPYIYIYHRMLIRRIYFMLIILLLLQLCAYQHEGGLPLHAHPRRLQKANRGGKVGTWCCSLRYADVNVVAS